MEVFHSSLLTGSKYIKEEKKWLCTSIVDSANYHNSYLGSEVPQQVINTVPRVKPVKNCVTFMQGQHNDYNYIATHTCIRRTRMKQKSCRKIKLFVEL